MTNTFGARVTSPSGVTTSTTASFTTTAVGDIVVFYIGLGNNFTTNKVNSLSSSHIGSWTEIGTAGGVQNATLGERIQAFWGKVTSTTTAPITINYQTPDATTNFAAWNFLSFHTDIASPVWTLDQQALSSATSSGGVTGSPALTPSAAGCVYVGGICGWTGVNGSTGGYTYTALDIFTDVTAYNLSAGTSSTSFAATQSGGSAYLRFGAVFKPGPSTTTYTKAGGGAAGSGGTGSRAFTHPATGGAAVGAAGTGSRVREHPTTGGGAAAGAATGSRVLAHAKTGGSAAGAAGSGSRSTVSTKTGGAAASGAASGAKIVRFPTTALMFLSASQTGLHTAGTVTRTAPMALAASPAGTKNASGTATASMALAATRAGTKGATGTRTAAMALSATRTGAKNAFGTRTASMTLAATYTATRASGVTRTAAMVLTTSTTATRATSVTRTAVMVLSATAVGVHLIAEVQPLLAKARLVVAYELVMVARIPQQSGPPTMIAVDPIDWTGLSYVDELNKAQQLTAGCTLANLTDPVKQHLEDMAHQPSELWLYRAGKLVFAGPLRTWQVQNNALTMQALGQLDYANQMVIEKDTVFSNADQFAIAAGLINNWQATPYGHFGIDTTSVGTSGVLRDATYLLKENNTVGKRLGELANRENGFNISVDPATRKLQLAYPFQGVDRSIGEDAIVFDERNITNANLMCSAAAGDVASDAFGIGTNTTGADVKTSTKWDDDLRVRYGRAGVGATFDGVSEQSTLDDHTQSLLDVRGNVLVIPGPDVRVTPDTDPSFYDVGDTVFYALNSLIKVEGGFRLRKRTVTVKATGQEAVSLAFA